MTDLQSDIPDNKKEKLFLKKRIRNCFMSKIKNARLEISNLCLN